MSESDKMSESEKDQLIDAQKEVIGILFEVIKRLQTNNDLDQEYFEIKDACMLHQPDYDFNDDIIPHGATLFARLAEQYLNKA